jgi:hypothetical protein
MSNNKSFVELENEFDDAMATIFSLYELMQNADISAEYKRDTFKMIGRGGFSSAKKAEKAFHTLMGLYIDEQQDIKRYMAQPVESEKPEKGPLVERAVSLVDRTQIKHTKQ